MRKCIVQLNDPEIGDYFICKRCKHFMLSIVTAEAHTKCTKRLLKTFVPDEQLYRCSTCGRYFDQLSQWRSHDELHKVIGNHDPTKYVIRIDQNNFVVN